MRVGITGHQRLKGPSGWDKVRQEIDEALARLEGPLVGITCLAVGADQVFADVVLRRGGSVEAIIPFEGYEQKFEDGPLKEAYRQLLGQATRVEVLGRHTSDEEAYFEAGKRVVDLSEVVLAVWDGRPAAGLGGTADVVKYANTVKKPPHVISV